jgi:hypothetical protein
LLPAPTSPRLDTADESIPQLSSQGVKLAREHTFITTHEDGFAYRLRQQTDRKGENQLEPCRGLQRSDHFEFSLRKLDLRRFECADVNMQGFASGLQCRHLKLAD